MKLLSPEALTVLGSMNVAGNYAEITAGQLDRKLYVEVNKALEAIGGKWHRGRCVHVFNGDPQDALDQIVLTGGFCDKKQEFGFFETPAVVVKMLVGWADLRPGHLVLEPSAGRGRIVDGIHDATLAPPVERLGKMVKLPTVKVTAIEVLKENADWLSDTFNPRWTRVVHADFLTWRPDLPFDRVVMNPPFARQADIDHVTHAYSMLAPGGRLVSVMSAGVMFRENKKTNDFRKLLKTVDPLPDGAFKESGTNVRTCIVTLEKP